jgi:predicted PurR-regulated permease PerM
MQTSVSTLLLVVSAVLLTCVVINYAVTTVEQTLQTNIQQVNRIQKLENAILNQTNNLINQTQSQLINQTQSQLINQTQSQP